MVVLLVVFQNYPRENLSGCHSLMVGVRGISPAIFTEQFQDFISHPYYAVVEEAAVMVIVFVEEQ